MGDEVARKAPSGFRPVLEYSIELHTLNLNEDKSKRREGKNPFMKARVHSLLPMARASVFAGSAGGRRRASRHCN
jgi:hypothetical protein